MTKKLIVGGIVVAFALVAGYIVVYTTPNTAQVVPQNENTNTSQNSKININAVCEGALAYMSFPSGAEAEAFVQECKEGKHPEVIDRYRAELNLGAGAEI